MMGKNVGIFMPPTENLTSEFSIIGPLCSTVQYQDGDLKRSSQSETNLIKVYSKKRSDKVR